MDHFEFKKKLLLFWIIIKNQIREKYCYFPIISAASGPVVLHLFAHFMSIFLASEGWNFLGPLRWIFQHCFSKDPKLTGQYNAAGVFS